MPRRKVSPLVEVEMKPEEAEYVYKVMLEEVKVVGTAVEVAEKEIEEILKNPLIIDIRDLMERGWFWFTVIPEKERGERGG